MRTLDKVRTPDLKRDGCVPCCGSKCTGAPDGCGGACPTTLCGGCCVQGYCKAGTASNYCDMGGVACQNCTVAGLV